MVKSTFKAGEQALLKRDRFPRLIEVLGKNGYTVAGPIVRDQAIVYDEISSIDDLPIGWTDEQNGGYYRLKKRDDKALFGFVVGPQSWKKFLFPAEIKLWDAKRTNNGFQINREKMSSSKMAFLGVRPCELHAIAIQDKVLMAGEYKDPIYQARRDALFLIAVNCTQPGGTCFCTSMGTGPRASAGYDLALTEIIDKRGHHFLVEIGTDRGAEIAAEIGLDTEVDDFGAIADKTLANAAKHMGRVLETAGIDDLLKHNLDNPRWDEVASRCLTCSNCTMVCPTCFCMNIDDFTDLGGTTASRLRRWDSCFTVEHSYIHGGSIRNSSKSRYRQWMTHKLGYWIEQFGTSGCVGCGRCITWCPAGIDITEEARAIRTSGSAGVSAVSVKEK